MNERGEDLRIVEAVSKLKRELRSDDNGYAYLQDLSVFMQDAASIVDLQRLRGVYDLLLRNIVIASVNDAPRTLAAIDLSYKEIVRYGNELQGREVPPVTDETAFDAVRHLQYEMNSADTELSHVAPAAIRSQFIDVIMFANQRLLTDQQTRAAVTRHHSLDFYAENIAAAYMRLGV